MRSHSRNFIGAACAVLLPVTAAQAQYYGASAPPPLYPYVAQQGHQPYAVQVAPNTYVIQRNEPARTRHVRQRTAPSAAPEKAGKRFDRPHKPVDHALVEELRRRHQTAEGVNTQKIVREAPIVHETRRIVDDPPRVVTQRSIVEDQPDGSKITTVEVIPPGPAPARAPARHAAGDDGKKRVIAADAEVTILGPDRMTIRLFRKGQGPKANARED